MAFLNLEIPPQTPGISEDARRALNDRFRHIQEQFSAKLQLDQDMDAGGFRITNLANPQSLNDAVNQASARRLVSTTTTTAPASTSTERVITETRVIGGGGGSALATIQALTLTTTTTAITASVPATTGALLMVFVTQDGTGGRAITWDTSAGNFKAGTPVNIAPTASTVTVFIFAGQADGFWWLLTNPMTEWTP